MKPKLNKTESTTALNSELFELQGLSNYRRDTDGSNAKNVNVSLYDVDYNIKWYIENTIKPTITENNSIITVPVVFASGEKWASIQRHGYLRDNQGKVLTPLLIIRRTGIEKRQDLEDLKVLESADNRILLERKYSKKNKYDQFSVLNKGAREREFYSLDVPKFVEISYELVGWANNTSQINEIIEQLIYFNGKAFGDTYKFITYLDSPSFETTNVVGEDRLNKVTIAVRTKGYLLNAKGPSVQTMNTLLSPNRIVLSTEVAVDVNNVYTTTTSNNKKIPLEPAPAEPIIELVLEDIDYNPVITYVDKIRSLTGTVANSSTVTFASGWITAPDGLPAVSINDFTFTFNGTTINKSDIISFTTNGTVSTLRINVSSFGNTFQNGDVIISTGKFTNLS
jgi:hypothetical protein